MPLLNGLEATFKATGFASVAGNKGAVMISFKIFKTSYCFLNCHLAAGPSQSKMDIRRQNAFEILRSIRPMVPTIEMPSAFDYFFWMGDFNFRVDRVFTEVMDVIKDVRKAITDYINNPNMNSAKKSDAAATLAELKARSYKTILDKDQLKIEFKNNTCFTQLTEDEIRFPPTYRRERGGNEEYSNKKNQSPSYTDRIIYCKKPHLKMKPIEYTSLEEQFGSDHRPVVALYDTQIIAPLNMWGDTLTEMSRHQTYIMQLTYMEVTIDHRKYSLFNPTQFQKKGNSSLKIYISFEENDLVLGEKATNLNSIDEQISELKLDFKLRGNELPSLFFATNNFDQIKQSSLNFQICLGDSAANREYIGFGAFSLEALVPPETKAPYKEPNIDLHSSVYFYSVLVGNVKVGAKIMTRSRKLKV
jgi:hypothetical protein